MDIRVLAEAKSLGEAAAGHAAESLRSTLQQKGSARIIAATGASQFEFLEALTSAPGIEWNKVEMFHLDEYVGLPITHPASFRKYLLERLIQKTGIEKYHLIDGEGDIQSVIQRVGRELNSSPIDVAFVGIGENGHLAFNDPPADFETESVSGGGLDQACRQQQVNEGWFGSLAEVATSFVMSVRQILKVPGDHCQCGRPAQGPGRAGLP